MAFRDRLKNGRQGPPALSGPEQRLAASRKRTARCVPLLEEGEEVKHGIAAVRGAPGSMWCVPARILITDRAVVVIRYFFLGRKPRGVLYRLPLTTRLTPVGTINGWLILPVTPPPPATHWKVSVPPADRALIDKLDQEAVTLASRASL
jgi:hypothetical protein